MPPKKDAGSKPADEGAAITAIGRALKLVTEQAAKDRVLSWALSAHGSEELRGSVADPKKAGVLDRAKGGAGGKGGGTPSVDFDTLIEQADPQSVDDRVIVVSFWLQENEAPEGFASQALNDRLKNMGHPVKNIAQELTKLIGRKPALVRQIKKLGKNKQSRKTYRLTDAGRRRVLALVRGEAGETEE